jgi:hypothetical protein
LKAKTLVFIISLFIAPRCNAQRAVKFQTGFGYLEHFSIGATFDWNKKNGIGIRYGSDFFYKPGDFSTYFIQYNRLISSFTYRRITPGLGAKIGYITFTDHYYKWKIISAVPFLSFRYSVNDRLELATEGGLAISRIESVTRVSYGEIGKYKRYLPELNLSLYYTIINGTRD